MVSPRRFTTIGSPLVPTEDRRQQLAIASDQTHDHRVRSKILDDIEACIKVHDPLDDRWEQHALRRRDDDEAVWTIPYRILQVDKDDDCHKLIEWHSTVSGERKSYWDGIHYHWNKRPYRKDNRHVPFLEDHWCDSVKSAKFLCVPLACTKHHDTSQEVGRFMFAVQLKIKILLELTALHLCKTSRDLIPEHVAPELVQRIRHYVAESPLVTNNKLIMNNEADLGPPIAELTKQLKALNRAMTRARYWFWPILLAQISRINGRWVTPPPSVVQKIRIEGYCYDRSSEMDSVPGLFANTTREVTDCMVQQGVGFLLGSTAESS